MGNRFFYLFIPFTTILLMSSCLDYVDQDAEDEKKILEYLKSNSLEAQKTENGVYYIIEQPGSNAKPVLTSVVKVHYTGKLLNGTVFDSSYITGVPIEGQLDSFIPGWIIGIPLFGKGGKGTLFIPSKFGYGNFSIGKIPANSVLIFDVHLIDFK